jgi:hypothetical protein
MNNQYLHCLSARSCFHTSQKLWYCIRWCFAQVFENTINSATASGLLQHFSNWICMVIWDRVRSVMHRYHSTYSLILTPPSSCFAAKLVRATSIANCSCTLGSAWRLGSALNTRASPSLAINYTFQFLDIMSFVAVQWKFERTFYLYN